MDDAQACAEAIHDAHQPATRTLAVFNTVKRAADVYKALKKQNGVEPLLIHSRFRPREREAHFDALLKEPPGEGTLAVTTQVVEAGVDVSAKTLFTETAPWASLVQRFGRCNRRGEFNKTCDAQIVWFPLPVDEKARDKASKPYELPDLVDARDASRARSRDSPPRFAGSV